MRRGQKAGAQLIFRGTPAYPAAFNNLNDAPPFFWAVGLMLFTLLKTRN